jgi:hypothetical protein
MEWRATIALYAWGATVAIQFHPIILYFFPTDPPHNLNIHHNNKILNPKKKKKNGAENN